jgi:DNA-binding transcriptional ArsR family regulator
MSVTSATPSDLDQTLLALADPTRRAILQRLSQGEARVTDLARPFDISLNAVSKHIRVLERARLVRRRRAGREHLLSFNPEPLDEAAGWIESRRAMWSRGLDALEAALRAEDEAARSGSRAGGSADSAAKAETPGTEASGETENHS